MLNKFFDPSTPTTDEEGLETVSYKNAARRGIHAGVQGTGTPKNTFGSSLKKLTVITGEKVSNDATKKFAAAPRDIFVYNAHPEITPDDVKEVLSEGQIKLYGDPVKKSHQDSWMSSFHVRVCHEDYGKLKVPEIWPVGWKCRDFIRRKPNRPGQGAGELHNRHQGQAHGGQGHGLVQDPAVLQNGGLQGIRPTNIH